jgi:hypothetical protein
MKFSVFWVITQREVVWNRRFGTTFLSHPQGSSSLTAWLLKVEPICGPETSVSNHLTLHNNPQDGRQDFNMHTAYNSQFVESKHVKCLLCTCTVLLLYKRFRVFFICVFPCILYINEQWCNSNKCTVFIKFCWSYIIVSVYIILLCATCLKLIFKTFLCF